MFSYIIKPSPLVTSLCLLRTSHRVVLLLSHGSLLILALTDWLGLTDYLLDYDFQACFIPDDIDNTWSMILY